MKKTKLTSLIVALTLIVQLFSAMTLSVSAAQYDRIGEYVSSTWNGRAYGTAMAEFGGEIYAYVGTVNAKGVGGGNTGGISVLKITNPSSINQVKVFEDGSIFLRDNPRNGDRLFVKDDCLYVLNGATAQLQIYRINTEDGTISTSNIWSSGQISSTGNGTIKVVGNLMFVGTEYTSNSSMRVYDISDSDNPVLLSTTTPVYPCMNTTGDFNTNNCVSQIGIYSFDVEDRGNGVYRVYANNRAKFGENQTERYFLSIRDITVSGTSYTVETLYEGQPDNTSYATGNGSSVNDIEVVNSSTLAIVDGGNRDGNKTLQMINVSTPSAPVHLLSDETDAEGLDIYSDGEIIAVAMKGNGTFVYAYDSVNNTLTKVKGINSDSANGWACDVGVYAGFIYVTGHETLLLHEYKAGIAIDSTDVDTIGGTITGSLEGYVPTTDTVTVNVGGTAYEATVSGTKFSVSVDEISGETVSVTASLIRSGAIVSTATKILNVKSIGNKIYDLSEFSTKAVKTISPTLGGRFTDAIGLNIGGKKLVYAYTNLGLEILDITDINNVTVTTNDAIKGAIYNSQMQIKDDYLIVVNTVNGRKVEFYKINSDGSLASAPALTVGGNSDTSKVTTIEIVDDYLFEAQQGSNQTMNVYDISDIDNGVINLGSTGSSYGVHAVEVQKISDNLYRTYFVTRSGSDWNFCISDMSITSDGRVAFEQKYLGNVIDCSYSSVKDIEYIGNNKLFVAIDDNNATSTIRIDVTDPAAPVATGETGRAFAAETFGDYYAIAIGGSANNVKIYDSNNEVVKDFYTTGYPIYNMSEYDGMMLISTQTALEFYEGLYTSIEVDEEDIQLASTVKISGNVSGYKAGDSVNVSVNGTEYVATIDSNGNFYCSYSPSQPETISVIASLIRNQEVILVDSGNIEIVNEYSDLSDMYIDTQMSILSSTAPTASGAEIWGSSNRLTSVAVAEIGEKTFAYTGSKNNLIVFDITDPSKPVMVQNNSINVYNSVYNKQIAVYNGYLITYNHTKTAIEFYAINSDGTLASQPYASLSVESDSVHRLTVEDNYLFVSILRSTGLIVYDISDINNIVKTGNIPVTTQAQSHIVEKISDGLYRVYMVVRDGSERNIGIYDVSITDGKLTYTEHYKGKPTKEISDYWQIKDMIKVGDTLVIGAEATGSSLEFINVANPKNPEWLYSIASTRVQSGVALTDNYFAYAIAESSALIYSVDSKADIASKALSAGNPYQTIYHKGKLIFAAYSKLVITDAATEVVLDETVLSGKEPVLSGEIYGYKSGDKLLASVNNQQASEINVSSDGSFDIPMTDAFANGSSAGVQLVVVRNGENILGEYFVVNNLGEYPYSITDVTNDDGVKITVRKNYDTDDVAKVYVAAYTGGKLESVDVIDAVEGVLPSDITFNPQTQNLKVFIWNENLTPIAEIAEPSFTEVAQNF